MAAMVLLPHLSGFITDLLYQASVIEADLDEEHTHTYLD